MATGIVSQVAGKLFTNPPRVAITTQMIRTWRIPFAPGLQVGEAVESVAADLVRVLPAPEFAIDDFVTSTSVDGTDLLIGWTGAVITEVGDAVLYRLNIVVTLDTTEVTERFIHLEVPS